jgi:hypothetical protein
VVCKTTFASGEASEAEHTFIVDIELSCALSEVNSRPPGEWRAILEDLHRRENLEFKSIVTDKLRRLFEE